jgi:hypothetical protein
MSRQFVFNPFTAKFDIIDVSAAGAIQKGSAELDFGTNPTGGLSYQTSLTITGQSWVTAATKVVPTVSRTSTTLHDADDIEIVELLPGVRDYVVGVGFTLTLYAPEGAFGSYFVDWVGV